MENERVWSFRPVDKPDIHDINEIDETKARKDKSINHGKLLVYVRRNETRRWRRSASGHSALWINQIYMTSTR